MSATTHVPVVLVSTPVGYRKTTLLALWAKRDERPSAWATLEAADNDPIGLIGSLLAALDPIPEGRTRRPYKPNPVQF